MTGQDAGSGYRRLLLTLLLPAGALAAARITVPGVDTTVFEDTGAFDPSLFGDPFLFGIFSLRVNPAVSAFLIVEVLALAITRWRSLRLGSYPERARLWRYALRLTVLLTVVQSFFIARWMQRTSQFFPGSDVLAPGWFPFVIVVLTLAAGSLLLVWLAGLIDRKGCGSGLAVFIVAFSVVEMGEALMSSARQELENAEPSLLPLALAAVVVAGVTRLAGGKPLRPDSSDARTFELPLIAGGILPLIVTRSLLEFPVLFANFEVDLGALGTALAPGTWGHRGTQAALVAGFTVAFAWLFNRPRAVADLWSRAGAADAEPPPASAVRERVRATFARSLAWSLAVGWALLAAEWVCADAQLDVALLGWTALVCLAVDVFHELRFRLAHGGLVGIFPVHRLYALSPMLVALDRAGIPNFARTRRYRTLWHFFAPYAPVEILVPLEHADRAGAVVSRASGQPLS